MARHASSIADLLHPPSRYLRSVQLDRDFHDAGALAHYVVTPDVAAAFRRLAEGLSPGSGRRAWRMTGDYGVGKSSFALVLAQLLSSPRSPEALRVADAMGWTPDGEASDLWPVLVTGTRERMVSSIARGLVECLKRRKAPGGGAPKALSAAIADADAVMRSGDPDALVALVAGVRTLAGDRGEGLLLIVDEMGKLLEHAAMDSGRGDVFVLQRLAELASRSGERPFIFVGLLHQGFQAYAERLPSSVRHEWDKVAGRFEEIVFDQPLAHTAALVAGALGVDVPRLGQAVCFAARQVAAQTGAMGWLGGATSTVAALDAAPLYPVHPTLLPPLVRFFARYGQHERSLFGFLLSSEPFGLQAFAERKAAGDAWYGLPEFYDYVRGTFGHRLSGGSYRSHWLRISGTVDAAHDLAPLELRVLKAAAVLNLLDAEDLPATDLALAACFSPAPAAGVGAAAATLVDRGLLFRRGSAGGYRLWPSSSVNLHAAFEAAARAIGPIGSVGAHLAPELPREPLLARRHYVESGTMRYFDIRHVPADALAAASAGPGEADGLLLVVLADTPEERRSALAAAAEASASRPDVVIGVSEPLADLGAELKDLRCWQWVSGNVPELAHDAYAAAEVSRQLAAARTAVSRAAPLSSGLRLDRSDGVAWFHLGRPLDVASGLSSALSDVCDGLYPSAPRVSNELINRNALSSAASAARMRLIEGVFEAADQPFLGIDPVRAPPEKSMYLSVIQKGGVHRAAGGSHEIVLPLQGRDPLNLAPALAEVQRLVEGGNGARVPVAAILEALARRPFGVRKGLAPLLLALVLKVRSHELAVYENGTFRASFGGQDAMRLIKAPAAFELQHCRIEGVRAEAFRRLAATFAATSRARPPEVLDVVQPLCRFAAQLPEYTRKAGSLGKRAAAVRAVLLSASEPATMLFRDLPAACGFEPFGLGAEPDEGRAQSFVGHLKDAVDELRADYPRLLGRIRETTAAAAGGGEGGFDRARLAARAARVTLKATQPRLRTFALRLRDLGTSDDSWAEALASYVAAKPPSKWNASDEGRTIEELAALGDLFRRVEAAGFGRDGARPDHAAVRINLTRDDGEDRVLILEAPPRDAVRADDLKAARGHLPKEKANLMRILMDLLWDELEPGAANGPSQSRSNRAGRSGPGAA